MRLESHEQWICRHALPSVALTVFGFVWGGMIGVVLYRMLGVNIATVNGRAPTFLDEVFLHGLDGAIAAGMLIGVLLLALFVARRRFRWWIVATLLMVVGTPTALYGGAKFVNSLWTLNQGGYTWENVVPQVIGLSVAWVIYVPIASWVSQYRFVIVRRDDSRKSPCPRCGYDLFGSSGTCPECEWHMPVGIAKDAAP